MNVQYIHYSVIKLVIPDKPFVLIFDFFPFLQDNLKVQLTPNMIFGMCNIWVILRRNVIYLFSRIILVYYCKCCNLIGYSTRYLFLDRLRVAKQ